MIGRRAFLAGAAAAAVVRPGTAHAAAFSFGPASFDVTTSSALVWLRAEAPGRVHVEYGTHPEVDRVSTTPRFAAGADTDFTVALPVTRLRPDTEYFYRGVATAGTGLLKGAIGRFRTAPDRPRAFSFGWGGDMEAGLQPFALLERAAGLDLFLMLGDTMYADVPKEQFSPTLTHYRFKHRENRLDAALQALLRTTPVAAVWDDHEVFNDFDRTYPAIADGLQAFREYWPTRARTLYRRFAWGPLVEFFVLDCRSYRSPKGDADGPAKTMLGADQKAWLKTALADSRATFKVIGSSIPFLPPSRPDSWAGYATERAELVDFIRRERIRNVVVLSADIHMALDWEQDGISEFVSGPIAAVLHCRGAGAEDRKREWAKLGRPFVCDALNLGIVDVRPGPPVELDVRIVDAAGAVRMRRVIRG
ncbi:MAG TPA: alkaline phosphatase D family protein [Terriglobales bacterium]|nr:alkaline phosphatase D family protein [Terriglobales bacterium]